MTVNPGEESAKIPLFLQKLMDLAASAGGEAPKPARPDTSFLEEIRLTAGNEQLITLFNQSEELSNCIKIWSDL